LIYGAQRHFQQYFSYIVAVSFIGAGTIPLNPDIYVHLYLFMKTLWQKFDTQKDTLILYINNKKKKKKKKKEYFHISIKGFFKPGVGIMSCPLVSKLFNYILMSLLVPIYEDVTVKSSSCRPMYWTHKITLVNTTL
jgi:hypothetical protein